LTKPGRMMESHEETRMTPREEGSEQVLSIDQTRQDELLRSFGIDLNPAEASTSEGSKGKETSAPVLPGGLGSTDGSPQIGPKSKEELVSELIESLKRQFTSFIGTGDGSGTPAPFTVQVDWKSKKKTLWLPANKESYSGNPAIGSAILFWLQLGNEVEFSEKVLTAQKLGVSDTKFWKAFMKELFREKSPEKLSFSSASDAERGTSAARSEMAKVYLKELKQTHLLSYLSPAIHTEVGNKTIEWLSVYLGKIGAEWDTESKKNVSQFLRQTFSDIAEKRYHIFRDTVQAVKVPISEVMKDLHKKVERKEGRTKKMVTVQPNRPSRRAEVLFEFELKFLEDEEETFDAYTEKIKTITEEKGVSLSKLEEERRTIKSLILKNWEVVNRTSALLTSRAKVLSEYLKEYDVGTKKPTKENYRIFLGGLNTTRLHGNGVSEVAGRIKLFTIIKNLTDDYESRVLVDRTLIEKTGNQTHIIHYLAGKDRQLISAFNEIATATGSTIAAQAPREAFGNEQLAQGGGFYEPLDEEQI